MLMKRLRIFVVICLVVYTLCQYIQIHNYQHIWKLSTHFKRHIIKKEQQRISISEVKPIPRALQHNGNNNTYKEGQRSSKVEVKPIPRALQHNGNNNTYKEEQRSSKVEVKPIPRALQHNGNNNTYKEGQRSSLVEVKPIPRVLQHNGNNNTYKEWQRSSKVEVKPIPRALQHNGNNTTYKEEQRSSKVEVKAMLSALQHNGNNTTYKEEQRSSKVEVKPIPKALQHNGKNTRYKEEQRSSKVEVKPIPRALQHNGKNIRYKEEQRSSKFENNQIRKASKHDENSPTYKEHQRKLHLKTNRYRKLFNTMKNTPAIKTHLKTNKYRKLGIKTHNNVMPKILDMIEVWFKKRSSVDNLLNKHEFVFHKDSNVCEDNPGVLIFVHSAIRNTNKRGLIRNSWGSIKRVKNVTIATVFMLGQTKHAYLQARISNESQTYGDIVQGNFIDSYRNMTYKHIMALHWAVLRCPNVNIIIKVDDDVLVNVFKLHTLNIPNSLVCVAIQNPKPFRKRNHDITSKWYVSPGEYPYNSYHHYCTGMLYFTSMSVVKRILEMSKVTRYFWIDDVYVTGVLRRMAGVGIKQLSHVHRVATNPVSKDSMFYWNVMDKFGLIWRNLYRLHPNSVSFKQL